MQTAVSALVEILQQPTPDAVSRDPDNFYPGQDQIVTIMKSTSDLLDASEQLIAEYRNVRTTLQTAGTKCTFTSDHEDNCRDMQKLITDRSRRIGDEIRSILDEEPLSKGQIAEIHPQHEELWQRFAGTSLQGDGQEDLVNKAQYWLKGLDKGRKTVTYISQFMQEGNDDGK